MTTSILSPITCKAVTSDSLTTGVVSCSQVQATSDITTTVGSIGATSGQIEGLVIRSLGNMHCGVDLQVDGNATIIGETYLTGVLSPTALTSGSTINDWNPGITGITIILASVSSTTNATITGLAGGVGGKLIYLINSGTSLSNTGSIILTNNGGGSSASNRFRLPSGGSLTLRYSSGSVLLWYDSTISNWRVLSSST